jgi:hypothetical protein
MQRSTRLTFVGSGLVLAMAALSGSWAACGQPGADPRAGAPRPSATPGGSPSMLASPTMRNENPPFVPKTYREGDRVVMPVTFPDGASAELTYPMDLDLASMGVQPDVSLVRVEYPPPRYPVLFVHGQPDPGLLMGDAPLENFSDSGIHVQLWRAAENAPTDSWLLYRLDTWSVFVAVPEELRAVEVVRAVDVQETADGFPFIQAQGPLALADEMGEGEGPVLTISEMDRMVILWPLPGSCRAEGPSGSGLYASLCLGVGDSTIFVSVYGDREFVGAVAGGLEARNLWPSTSEQAAAPRSELPPPFTPRTYFEGGRVVMPVRFPDGTTAEVTYSPGLDLAGMGARPYSSGGGRLPARDFSIFRGRLDQVLAALGPAQKLGWYGDGRGGTVGFWHLSPDAEANELAFEFGSWTVLVYDYTLGSAGPPMAEEERALWARSLRGRETSDGFLVLKARPPLRLASAGDHAGPELVFGNRDRMVLLFPGRCKAKPAGSEDVEVVNGLHVSRSPGFASWCVPEASMVVHVYQGKADTFIDQVLESLQIRNVRLARRPG